MTNFLSMLIQGILWLNSAKNACTSLISSENELNDLDRAAGDGDTGTTLSRGANCKYFIKTYLEYNSNTKTFSPLNQILFPPKCFACRSLSTKKILEVLYLFNNIEP